MLDKLNIFINKYIDNKPSIFGQKKIQQLLEKKIFKVFTLNKVVILKKISSNTQFFYIYFDNDMKDIYIDKSNMGNCRVVYAYNNEKINFILIHLLKILRINQDISFCFTTII